jgi:hypothetical protein
MRILINSELVRRAFGPKRVEILGRWRKLHNEGLHNLASSSSVIKMITSRRMRRAGSVACIEIKRNVSRILVGTPETSRKTQTFVKR